MATPIIRAAMKSREIDRRMVYKSFMATDCGCTQIYFHWLFGETEQTTVISSPPIFLFCTLSFPKAAGFKLETPLLIPP